MFQKVNSVQIKSTTEFANCIAQFVKSIGAEMPQTKSHGIRSFCANITDKHLKLEMNPWNITILHNGCSDEKGHGSRQKARQILQSVIETADRIIRQVLT